MHSDLYKIPVQSPRLRRSTSLSLDLCEVSLVLRGPPIWQRPPIDARCRLLPMLWLPQLLYEVNELLLKGLAIVVEGGVCTLHKEPYAARFHEILRVRHYPDLPSQERPVAV